VAREHDVARPKCERLGTAQPASVEQPDQRPVTDAGRVLARGLGEQRGGFLAAQSLGQLSGDVSPLPR
jgi:hypothetical protein